MGCPSACRPCVVVCQGYSLLDLFLILNVITTCCTFPILSGESHVTSQHTILWM